MSLPLISTFGYYGKFTPTERIEPNLGTISTFGWFTTSIEDLTKNTIDVDGIIGINMTLDTHVSSGLYCSVGLNRNADFETLINRNAELETNLNTEIEITTLTT
tara:strand:+ start:665 stop:976 length:312 start_codon:yes stop_codon:yes gene_type:complete